MKSEKQSRFAEWYTVTNAKKCIKLKEKKNWNKKLWYHKEEAQYEIKYEWEDDSKWG